jgi:hypothetical protein
MNIPKEFFTMQSMLTLTGATGITFVVCNGLQHALDFNPRWLALVIAQIICLYGVYVTGHSWGDLIPGVANGFLVYSTACGATATVGTAPPEEQRNLTSRRRFRTRWF